MDDYLKKVPEPQRSTLRKVQLAIRALLPYAEECISYNMPAFRVDGTVVAGFAAFKQHCSYFPHSGDVIPALGSALAKYDSDAGTLRFPVDKPLPPAVLKKLIAKRLEQESAKAAKDGKVRAFYNNGSVKFHGQHKDSKMHGEWKFYRRDGSLMRSGKMKAGEQVGTWSTWNAEGKLVKTTEMT